MRLRKPRRYQPQTHERTAAPTDEEGLFSELDESGWFPEDEEPAAEEREPEHEVPAADHKPEHKTPATEQHEPAEPEERVGEHAEPLEEEEEAGEDEEAGSSEEKTRVWGKHSWAGDEDKKEEDKDKKEEDKEARPEQAADEPQSQGKWVANQAQKAGGPSDYELDSWLRLPSFEPTRGERLEEMATYASPPMRVVASFLLRFLPSRLGKTKSTSVSRSSSNVLVIAIVLLTVLSLLIAGIIAALLIQ